MWEEILTHSFIIELGEGNLPHEKFSYYVKQDFLYLLEFARCLSLAVVKTDDIEIMQNLVSLLNGCLTVEIQMLHKLSEKLQISTRELEETKIAPTNMGYTRHLLSIAFSGTIGEIIASLLPCMWTYQVIGKNLVKCKGLQENPVYYEWVKTYQSQKYIQLVDWYKELTNRYASESGKHIKEKMKRHFELSSKYEYMFWDMAYTMEEWPV